MKDMKSVIWKFGQSTSQIRSILPFKHFVYISNLIRKKKNCIIKYKLYILKNVNVKRVPICTLTNTFKQHTAVWWSRYNVLECFQTNILIYWVNILLFTRACVIFTLWEYLSISRCCFVNVSIWKNSKAN